MKGLGYREGLTDTSRLDDDCIVERFFCECFDGDQEVSSQSTADTPISHLDEFFLCRLEGEVISFDKICIDIYLCHVIDNDCDFLISPLFEYMFEEGRFSASEKSGEHSDGCFDRHRVSGGLGGYMTVTT